MEDRKDQKQNVQTEPGEPGRTPGSAEGERESIDEALEQQSRHSER
jgi:hypothetical protein